MTKLCKPPPLQGMLLLAALLLLVLASISIQAGPVMAASLGQFVEGFENVAKHLPAPREHANPVKSATGSAAVTDLAKQRADFKRGLRKGKKLHKKLCKAQDLLAKQNDPSAADGDGNLVPMFSYYMTSASQGGAGIVPSCWSSHEKPPQEVPLPTLAAAALIPGPDDDGLYYVQMTGVRVGQGPVLLVQTPPPTPYLYLNTFQQYTYIDSRMYNRLTAELMNQMNMQQPNPNAADKLCYDAALSSVPRIAILLATAGNGNNRVQQIAAMSERALGGEAGGDAWYRESTSVVCLGIRPATPAQPPVLGSMIQSGRTMAVNLAAGTLTF